MSDSSPICVTGASGFIASHLVEQLLEKGLRVRGTVRKTAEDYPHLTGLAGASERLELVTAQLLEEGSYDAAVEGCEVVMHTASPYVINVKDPQRDLVDPAVQGTLNVLKACAQAGVKRVVLTSSMAAVTDEPRSEHIYTEDDWNEKSSLERNPYYYSKTMAERAAWDFIKEQSPSFDLVVINPFLVIGPAKTKALNPSNGVIKDLLSGTFPGLINVSWGLVDVRDVARAHGLAMDLEKPAGRYLCASETLSMRELVEHLKSLGYEGYKLPKLNLECKIGDWMVVLGSYFQPKSTGTYLRTHIGRVPNFDNSKIKNTLGLEFMPMEQSLKDTVEDLLGWQHLKKL